MRLGVEVVGTTTRPERTSEIEGVGARAAVLTVADPRLLSAALEGADTVFVTLAAGRGGDYREVYVEGLRSVVGALDLRTARQVLYTSATSVYGEDEGGWVDGDTAPEPQSERGRLLVEAEGLLLEGAGRAAVGALVLRLAGIWGPGREPSSWMQRRGPVIPGDGTGYLNLVHRDDAVSALLAAAERRVCGTLALADDRPQRRRDLYPALAAKLGVPAPRFADAPADPGRGTGKRVSNAKALKALGISLAFPEGPPR